MKKKIMVQVLEAKPNLMFSQWQTDITKFLRFSEAVPCAFCGRKSKHHWTLTVPFRVMSDEHIFTPTPSEKLFQPGNQVCRKHILAPEMPKPRKPRRKR